MEAFSISCTTCGRKLRVRDPSLIGQILACPKCHGMVLISPPVDELEGAEKPQEAGDLSNADAGLGPSDMAGEREADQRQLALGDGAVDSQAVTREGIETRLPNPAAIVPPGAPWETDPSAVPPVVGQGSGTAFGTAEPFSPGHPVQWQSESSARARQIAGIVLLGLVCLVSAAGVFGFVVRRWQASRSEAAAEVGIADAVAGGANPIPSADPTPNPDTPADPADPASQSADAATADLGRAGAEPSVGEEPLSTPAEDPASTTTKDSTGDIPAGEISAGDAPAGDAPNPAGVSVEGADNPLATPPAAASVEPLFPEAGGIAGGVQDVVPEATELPAGLQQYMPLIDLAQGADQPRGNDLPPPPTMEDLRVDAPDQAIPESEYPPAAEPVDVRMRMQSRVLGIEVKDRPLDQVVRVLSQIGGVPIEFDLISLDIAGIRADAPISLRIADESAGVVLARAIDAAGCGMTLGDDGIVRVFPKPAAFEAGLAEALSVSDFEGLLPIDAEDLQRLISEGDTPVQVAGEVTAGGWAIEGPAEAKIRAALVMEGLRLARGLPPRLPSERTSRWLFSGVAEDLELRVDWQPLPEVPVSLDFDRPRAIEMIVGDVAREQDAAAVIDWDSAWAHGLTPEAAALPWLRGRTAPQVISETLEPFGLEAFVAGQGVWWVGTRDAYEQAPVVAVLSTSLTTNDTLPRREEMLRRIALAAGQESPAGVAAMIDEESGKLIVRLPRYLVRELPAVLADQ